MIALEAVRKNKKLTQFKLAALAEVGQATICFIENRVTRRPSVDVITKLGNALGAPPDLLLFDVNDLSATDKKALGL